MEKLIEIAIGITERASCRGRAANPKKKMQGMVSCVMRMFHSKQDHVNAIRPSYHIELSGTKTLKERRMNRLRTSCSDLIVIPFIIFKKRRGGSKRWRVIQSPSSLQSLTV